MIELPYWDPAQSSSADTGEHYQWRCVLCGTQETDLRRLRCRRCDGAIDAFHDLSRVTVRDDPNPLVRYGDLLPLRDVGAARWLGEGNTPWLHAEALGRRIGMDAVFLKDESANPTRSTKDRVASVALARFAELGIRNLALSSTGNTSTAYARAAQLLGGFKLHIFVGREFHHRLNYPDHPHVMTYVVNDGFDAAGRAAKHFSSATGVRFEGGFFNPARREGLKLAYLEAFDQLPTTPRYVFQAVSSGMGLLGAYKGAVEYHRLGRIPKVPALVAVQQETCAPMAAAFADRAPAIESRHIVTRPTGPAAAILRGDPTATYPYIDAICRQTGGAIRSASLERIEEARRLLNELEGLSVCHASATALAGLMDAREQRLIAGDAPVLVNLTGAERPVSPTPRDIRAYDAHRSAEDYETVRA